GWTSWEALQRINADSNLVGQVTTLPAEGSILPGSYDYMPGDTRQSVLDKMQQAMTTQLAAVWEGRVEDLPVEPPEQLLVLDSTVEQAAAVASERPQYAAAFLNPLRDGMRLPSDPTIIYGLTKGLTKPDRGPRRSEIEARTPYNA